MGRFERMRGERPSGGPARRAERRGVSHCGTGLAAAGLCFVLAAILRFAVIGYGTLALCFALAGAAILGYLYLPKAGRTVLTALLCAGAAVFAAAEVPVILAAGGSPETDADYLIVLGAGVLGDEPSLSLLERLQAARDYLAAHPDCTAIVSGGQGAGERATEATVMFSWLCDHGVEPGRMIREERATSTLENLEFSFALIPAARREKAVIAVLSSEYHLCRAEYLARRLGVQVAGIPARTALPALRINYFIREGLGMVYYRLGLGKR